MKIKIPSATNRSRRHRSFLGQAVRAACLGILLLLPGHLSAGPSAATPFVSVSVSPSPISSINQEAAFTISLSEPTSRTLGVAFFMSGGARFAFDYLLIGNFDRYGQIIVPAGETSATVTLHTLFRDPSVPQAQAIMNRLEAPKRAHLVIELP